jgi:hypothetical protein
MSTVTKPKDPKALYRFKLAEFRLWTFHVAYERIYRAERDRTLRFAKALLYSLREPRFPLAVEKWYAERNSKWMRRNRGTHDRDVELDAVDYEPEQGDDDGD